MTKILLSSNRLVEAGKGYQYLTTHFEDGICVREFTIEPGGSASLKPDTAVLRVILPIVGRVRLNDKQSFSQVEVGQMRFDSLTKKDAYQFHNTFEKERIHFLEIWIQHATEIHTTSAFELAINQLNRLLHHREELMPYRFYLGKFGNRKKGHLRMIDPGTTFVFVVQGAFEFEDRLLQERDGLLMSEKQKLDFECLAAEGIMLVVTKA